MDYYFHGVKIPEELQITTAVPEMIDYLKEMELDEPRHLTFGIGPSNEWSLHPQIKRAQERRRLARKRIGR